MENVGNDFKNAFNNVNEIIRNCLRILVSSDLILQENDFNKCANDWVHVFPEPNKQFRSTLIRDINESDSLLTTYMFHQYISDKYSNTLFSMIVAPWRFNQSENFTPVCSATIFKYKDTTGTELYHIGSILLWNSKNNFDSQVHEYHEYGDLISGSKREKFNEFVENKIVYGISVPLEKITSSNELLELLIKPLLKKYDEIYL